MVFDWRGEHTSRYEAIQSIGASSAARREAAPLNAAGGARRAARCWTTAAHFVLLELDQAVAPTMVLVCERAGPPALVDRLTVQWCGWLKPNLERFPSDRHARENKFPGRFDKSNWRCTMRRPDPLLLDKATTVPASGLPAPRRCWYLFVLHAYIRRTARSPPANFVRSSVRWCGYPAHPG